MNVILIKLYCIFICDHVIVVNDVEYYWMMNMMNQSFGYKPAGVFYCNFFIVADLEWCLGQ